MSLSLLVDALTRVEPGPARTFIALGKMDP